MACSLIAALAARGATVQGFKVGPDYIDPTHHSLASGRPPRNLDAFLSGPSLIAPLFRHGAQGADISIIEGVMGLYDGASGQGELASTAQVAKLLDAAVILVVDAGAMARSAAAIVHGYRTFDPDVHVAGVIFNRVGSEAHERLLRDAVTSLGMPVLGALRRDDGLAAPERHLGLVPAIEDRAAASARIERLASAAAERLDLDALVRLAGAAPAIRAAGWSPELELRHSAPCRIAVASGPVFSFHYTENLELLRAAGAELLPFDPLAEPRVPDAADGLLLAGGFPEVFAAELAANLPLRESVARFASARPVIAECGGLAFLADELDGHPMCGVLPVRARMTGRLKLGYREAVAATGTPWLEAGKRIRGHEFHYSEIEPSHGGTRPAWRMTGREAERADGCVRGGVQAGYLHVHWAAYPEVPGRLAAACAPTRSVA